MTLEYEYEHLSSVYFSVYVENLAIRIKTFSRIQSVITSVDTH